MSNLKLGIIGAGYIAEKHLEVISKIRRLKVVGITSRTFSKAKKLANKFGIKNIYLDYVSLFNNNKLDGILILVSPEEIYPVLNQIIPYRIPFFVEKPPGLSFFEIQKNIYEQRRIAQIKLLGEVIKSLQFSASGKIVWIVISQNMIKKVNGSDEDVDGFTEFLRMIQGVEISFMILEKPDGTHRISFRSSGKYTVNDVAKLFNGGGHKFAAGASMKNISANDLEKKINSKLVAKIQGDF